MVKKIFIIMLLLFSHLSYSQKINEIYKVDDNIIIKVLPMNDTNIHFQYFKDSSIFESIKSINDSLEIFIEKDTNGFYIFKILNYCINTNNSNDIRNFSNEAFTELYELNFVRAYIITSKLNTEKYIVIEGVREHSYGSHFARYFFVFKIFTKVVSCSFFYKTIDSAECEQNFCIGCFLNIKNGRHIGFKERLKNEKSYKIHYVRNLQIRTIPKLFNSF